MPMRKHRVPRNFFRVPVKNSDQLLLTLQSHGTLMGTRSPVETMIHNARRQQERIAAVVEADLAEQARLKLKLGLEGPLEPEDQKRVDAAKTRRQRQVRTRARSYARCVFKNPCLHEERYMARVKIGNHNYVDKHFVKKFG